MYFPCDFYESYHTLTSGTFKTASFYVFVHSSFAVVKFYLNVISRSFFCIFVYKKYSLSSPAVFFPAFYSFTLAHHFTDPASHTSLHDFSPDPQVSCCPHTGRLLSEVLPRTQVWNTDPVSRSGSARHPGMQSVQGFLLLCG